jgi:hypothetical protein
MSDEQLKEFINQPDIMLDLIENVQKKKSCEWDELSKILHLNDQQRHRLENFITQNLFNLRAYSRQKIAGPDRKQLVGRLNTLSRHLGHLEVEIERAKNDLEKILPWELGIELTRLLSLESMEAALRAPLPNWVLIEENGYQKINEAERQPFAITRGVALLQHTITSIRAPIEKWLYLNSLNKGRPPEKSFRAYLLMQLALNAKAITGLAPDAGHSGSFIELCNAVFHFIGFQTDGLQKAISKVLKDLKKAGIDLDD